MVSHFLDQLDLRLVRDDGPRPIFRTLASMAFFSAQQNREFTVPPGIETDGPSVPMVGMLLVGYRGMRAAVLHDWLLRCDDVPRETADLVFYEALVVCGVESVTASAMYLAVSSRTSSLRNPSTGSPSMDTFA